jgi:type I restriction enzyme S subunit
MKWPRVRLGRILSLEYGSALKECDRDSTGSVPVAGSNGIVGNHSEALVHGPGIVVGRKGSAGEVTWLDSGFWPIDTTYYVEVHAPCELRWVYYLLKFLNLKSLSLVTGVPGLNRNDAYRLELLLPPVSEQRWIVEILDQADALRKQHAEADAKAERILPAIFHGMFGDPATNPKNWNVVPLGELTSEFRYGTSTKCHPAGAGLSVLRIPNIIGGEVDLTDLKSAELPDDEVERLRLRLGDLLFVRTNGNREYVGRCAVFDLEEPYLFASYLIRARLEESKADPWYVAAFMRTPRGRQVMAPFIRTTAGQSNISIDGLSQIPVPCPPLVEQQKFRGYVESLRALGRHWHRAGTVLYQTFATLLHRAFTGDLTGKWRRAHSKELLSEMEEQACLLQRAQSFTNAGFVESKGSKTTGRVSRRRRQRSAKNRR